MRHTDCPPETGFPGGTGPLEGSAQRTKVLPAGQSSEKAVLIYQHSDDERRRDVAAGAR